MDKSQARVLSSPNRLKTGVFGFNLSGGVSAITFADGPPRVGQWSESRDIAIAADQAGFEALVPVARWKGYGGPSGFWDRCFETFTWGAALAEATERIQIFTTCHVPVFHPIMAATMGATLDHISGGRWGLNVVAGWLGAEFEMFGLDLPDHTTRYGVAGEWVEVLKRLWVEHEEFDHEGTYFSNLRGCVVGLKPVQSPYPVIMNAALSEAGLEFATKHADMIFIPLTNPDNIPRDIANVRRHAEAADREIGIWGSIHILCRETEEEVNRYVDYYVDEMGDREGAARYGASILGATSQWTDVFDDNPDLVRTLMRAIGAHVIAGTPAQVVEKLAHLSKLGVEGVAIGFVDYLDGIARFRADIEPLLVDIGLRERT
jgi:alkanesulfonate monooxygenase SsuD/methylene tetrahydromethanopterin reductase-like flavin-dependent oxidoreductase (luciferase family)